MIIAETIIAATVLCSAPPKKRLEQKLHYFTSGNTCGNTFQVSSGMSLERRLRMELEAIDGVRTVAVRKNGDLLNVNVVLDTLEFAAFEKVVQKELELFDTHPDLRVRFNIEPFSPTEDTAPALHAA